MNSNYDEMMRGESTGNSIKSVLFDGKLYNNN